MWGLFRFKKNKIEIKLKKAVIINDTTNEFHHGCEIVVFNIKRLLKINGIEVIDSSLAGFNWKNNIDFLNSMKSADLIIVNGEGTLQHAQDRAKQIVIVGEYAKEILKKPVVLINSTYQENGDEIARYLKYFDLIYVRESLSQIDLIKHGINSIVVPDMTFYSKYDLSKKKQTNFLGYTDSVISKTSEVLYEQCLSNNGIFLPALTSIKLNSFNHITLLKFVKFHMMRSFRFILWKLKIKISYDYVRQFYFINSYDSYIDKIASLKFIFIGRYHSLCFALKTLTPFIALKSNSHKIEGILSDIGISSRIKKTNEINEFELLEFSEIEKQRINEYIKIAPLKIEKMFKDIKNLLN